MTKSELIESIARSQKHLPAKDVELAVKQSQPAMAARGGQWNELTTGLAGTRDDDLLAGLSPLDEFRQLGLRLMNGHVFRRPAVWIVIS